jgi:hypothetical protein
MKNLEIVRKLVSAEGFSLSGLEKSIVDGTWHSGSLGLDSRAPGLRHTTKGGKFRTSARPLCKAAASSYEERMVGHTRGEKARVVHVHAVICGHDVQIWLQDVFGQMCGPGA